MPERLEPGQTPPRFVVISWDGAASLETGLFPRFRSLAAEYGAAMTFFLGRAYTTNRAPLFIGKHFEQWNGGIHMDAVEEALRQTAEQPDARLVSFRQLVAWLEVQDPTTLARLRTLSPGQPPPDGWPVLLAS